MDEERDREYEKYKRLIRELAEIYGEISKTLKPVTRAYEILASIEDGNGDA